jgi:hypothetical protein
MEPLSPSGGLSANLTRIEMLGFFTLAATITAGLLACWLLFRYGQCDDKDFEQYGSIRSGKNQS